MSRWSNQKYQTLKAANDKNKKKKPDNEVVKEAITSVVEPDIRAE